MNAADAPATGRNGEASSAEIVVVGPAPPLRGGIAAHTACLVEGLRRQGTRAVAASWQRLYPERFHPARRLTTGASQPGWSRQLLDVLGPSTWAALRKELEASTAKVVLQWWHPAVAPALLGITRGLPRERVVAVCHNAQPHEWWPGAAVAARRVLSRCGRIVCHSPVEADTVAKLLGTTGTQIVHVPLPCLFAATEFAAARVAPELSSLPAGARLFVAAGHLRPYKGTALLMTAWLAAKRPPGARLVVVGESYLRGAARRAVAALVASDPSIIFIDRYVDDAEFVYSLASAEAVVAAHLSASQSGVLPLARTLGVPCIVSDAGSLALQATEKAGDPDVVEAGDAAKLAAVFEGRFLLEARADPGAALRRAAARENSADWRPVLEAIGIDCRP